MIFKSLIEQVKQIITYFLAALVLVSCGTKWKKTTSCTMMLEIPQRSSYVVIQSVTFPIQSIQYSGKREKGADVEFTSSIEETVSFYNNNNTYSKTYDMPQGFYQSAQLKYTLHQGLVVRGVIYDNYDMVDYVNFKFTLNEPVTFYAEASGFQISLDKQYIYLSSLYIDRWFEGLNFDELEWGDYYYDNDTQQFILEIDASKNTSLYHTIKNKIENRLDLSIK